MKYVQAIQVKTFLKQHISDTGQAALLGLRTAISGGDLRAIHLLLWAGLREKLDVETVIWAVRNAGGNRVNVAEDLMTPWLIYCIVPIRDLMKFSRALSEIKDQAEVEFDQGDACFL